MERRTYRFGASSLSLVFGDITESDADAIVSSDDYMLTMGGGVSRAILRKAGEGLAFDVAKHIPASLGDVVVTAAGALPSKYVFHAVTIGDRSDEIDDADVLDLLTSRCLALTEMLKLESIAFPSIGAGVARFSYEDVAVKMAENISMVLRSRETPLSVEIYLFDRYGNMTQMDYIRFFEEFASRVKELPSAEPDSTSSEKTSLEPENNAVLRRKTAAKNLAELTQERDRIERRLAELAGALDSDELSTLQSRLDEIHKLRLTALAESKQLTGNGCRLFISYSHKDAEHRDSLRTHLRALERQKLVTAWIDRMITAGTEWQGQIDKNLETSEVILLLISANFIESKYCFDIELSRALERHEAGDALVIPVLVRPVVWEDMPFAKLQALPTDRKAVTLWDNHDLAWVDVAEGIKIAIEEFAKRDQITKA